jgi:hypothetical protein
MNKLSNSLRPFAFPLALLSLMVLAFGLLIPTLGFFWDDWPVLLTNRLLGNAGLWEFYTYDRPISAWTYVLTLPILGESAPAWHIFTLLLRFATALALWITLRGIWPERRNEAAYAALLFAVYPIFIQQPISVAYSQHWITYLLFFISLGGMVYAVRRPRLFWPLTALSVFTAALHLATMEYFAGLELIRPLVLWLVLSNEAAPRLARLRRTLVYYLPYLLVLIGFFIWRLFLLHIPGEDVNSPTLLIEMLRTPLPALQRLAEFVLQDMMQALVFVWSRLVDPNTVDLHQLTTFLFWLVALITGVAAFFFLSFYRRNSEDAPIQPDRWPLQAMGLGMTIILAGMLPVWLSDRQMIEGLYGNRYGLPAMFGAALLWVGLLRWLVAGRMKQILLVSIMLGLAVGLHLRVANDYRWSWISQQRFYWQLNWRAPSIAPHTAILSDGEIFPFVGWYSTAAGINLLYPEGQGEDLNYWFFSLGREIEYQLPEFLDGITLKQGLRNYTFEGESKNGLVIHYEPNDFDCLIILSPEDAELPDLPSITRRALPNANPSRILAQSSPLPSTAIFGPEPEHTWCYYYQKASLARQFADWDAVVQLGDQVQAQGYHPRKSTSDTPHEWLPFIEGYAMTGQLEKAREISQTVLSEDERMLVSLCQLWEKIDLQAGDPAANDIHGALGCQN